MSRMTSDIENLQQLLQDGLAQFAVQGLTMVVIAVILFLTNPLLAVDHRAADRPAAHGRVVVVPVASVRGYDLVRDGIANVLADLSESLHGVRVVTAHNRQDRNVVHHRNVVGRYRDANFYTARINARVRLRHPDARLPRPGRAAGHRRHDGPARLAQRRRADRLLPVPEPVHAADPAARPAVQLLPAGSVVDGQAARPVRHRAERAREARRRRPAADRRRDRVRPRHLRLRPGRAGDPRRRPARSAPARRSPSSGRPAPASRRWPSSSPASTTRPRAGS